ncbi:MAG: hypothetical protein M1827_000809 [Pycnora praestabilis]|nr:MAG: hypothetical protein M1827_000809 [Pycnora praestabilis]
MLDQKADDGAPKPAKRSLFSSKPAWSKPQPTETTGDLFSRSNGIYADIVAEAELRRRRKLERRQVRREHQQGAPTRRGGKRRRITDESDSGNDTTSDEAEAEVKKQVPYDKVTKPRDENRPPTPPLEAQGSPTSLLKRYEESFTAANEKKAALPPQSIVIDLEDEEQQEEEDDDGDIPYSRPLHVPNDKLELNNKSVIQTEEDDNAAASDEEFPELARKARERAKLKRMELENKTQSTPDPLSTRSNENTVPPVPSLIHAPPLPPADDPVVDILITSELENTNPLLVRRKIGQRLKDCRLAWCQKQRFDEESSKAVFLTWKGKRLFDVTTCKSLGIGVDLDGNVVLKGEKDVMGEENRQIHMEATTEEMLQEVRRLRQGGAAEQASEQAEELDEVSIPKPVEQTKIILKNKAFEDFKLIVKPSTTILRIITAFRITNKVEPEKEVFLVFDGDRLDPSSTVGETDFSDMDHVDVHVK